jgi:hypothetical protein
MSAQDLRAFSCLAARATHLGSLLCFANAAAIVRVPFPAFFFVLALQYNAMRERALGVVMDMGSTHLRLRFLLLLPVYCFLSLFWRQPIPLGT